MTWGLVTSTLPSRYIDRKFLWAISRLLFLVAGKASRVLVHRCITSETFHNVQNANRRCTSHSIMLTERGNYGLIPMHALFLAIGPNQKSLSSCCMKVLSHSPEIKNSGRCAPWNFTKRYCKYTCLQNNISISFLLQKNKPTQSTTIVLTLWVYRREDKLQSCILVWRDSKKRCAHCNWPIVRTFGRHSCVARATAISILHTRQCRNRPKKFTIDMPSKNPPGKLMEEYWFLTLMSRLAITSASFEFFFSETLHDNFRVARAKQLSRSMKKTTSCKKARELPG